MVSFSHTIQDPEGLHARPVTTIVAALRGRQSAVTVTCGVCSAAGDDLMGLMALNARRGDVLEVSVEGPDEDETAEALRGVFTF